MHTFRTVRPRALLLVTFTLVATLTLPVLSARADPTGTSDLVVPCVISGMSPTSGLVVGGAVVTVTGQNFTAASAVAFGDVAATSFDVVSPTTLVAISPKLTKGSYRLAVTTAAGTTTAGTFTVRTLEDEVLRLVNEARSAKRKCGSSTYKAAAALRWDATLARVAAAHSADMSARAYFSHNSRNGDSPFDRIKDTGYRYSSAGENIAAGYRTPKSVVNAWLKSPGHCKNIMRRSYTELGVGYATGGEYGSYWTQDFGNPR